VSPVQHGSAKAAIADRIRLVRSHYGMTQEDFAEAINVSRSHLSAVETYRIEPSIECILGVLVCDLRLSADDDLHRPVDPTWLLLGPYAEPDMWGKLRPGFEKRSSDDRYLWAEWLQNGVPDHLELDVDATSWTVRRKPPSS